MESRHTKVGTASWGSAHEQISAANLFWAIAVFSYAAMLTRTGLAQQQMNKYAGVPRQAAG
jgi:hypothetical protein